MATTRPPENATAAMYRAALGPLSAGTHLPVFVRFDEAGLPGPAFNRWAALGTTGWLVFHRLWTAALAWAALLALGTAGLLASIDTWRAWPPVAQGVLLGGLALAAFVLPGWFAVALLHDRVRQRMTAAVRASQTVQQACERLADAAPGRGWLVVAGLVQAAVALGLVAVVAVSLSDRFTTVPTVVAAPTATDSPPAPVATPTPAPAPAPAPEATPPTASNPSSGATEGATPAASGSPGSSPPAGAPASGAAAAPPAAPAAPAPPAADAEPPAVKAASPVPAVPAPEAAVRPRIKGHGVAVGLFGDPANAERARQRLAAAGLPVLTDPVESARGTLTRVRVGPFESREQADDAARRIRALGLDARPYSP